MTFQALRGFRDYLPPDATKRAEVLTTIREVSRRYGFEEVETPSVESIDLFKTKSGEGIVDETFSFTDKGGRDVTLIPENTPSIARILASRTKSTPMPVKWVSVSKLWRYEEPQSGRSREFSQVSLDIFGSEGTEADLELLSTTRAILDGLGLRGRYVFKISDRRLTENLAVVMGATDQASFFRTLDRFRKVKVETFLAELESAGISRAAAERFCRLIDGISAEKDIMKQFDMVTEFGTISDEGVKGLSNLRHLFSLGESFGLSSVMSFDITLVRGLAYYTSTVFEAFDTGESLRALFGGGRYDRLIELFGGDHVPACGLAIGDQTLELLLRESHLWPAEPSGLDAYVATASEAMSTISFKLTERLRDNGLAADHDIMTRNLSGQLKEAARRKAKFLIIVGPKEQAVGKVMLRNMQSGQQDAVSEEDALRSILGAVSRGAAKPQPQA